MINHMTGKVTKLAARRDATMKPASDQMIHSHEVNIDKTTITATTHMAPRRTIDLESLSLPSYMRLCTLISVCIGIVMSALFCFLDILGIDTTFRLGIISFADTETGVVVLFVGPFVFGVMGFIGSLFSYRLFVWALLRFWGLRLTGTWKELGKPEGAKSTPAPM